MPLIVKDRIKVTSTTVGTGTFTLGSAEPGYQDFSVIGDGNQTYYTIADETDWEVGIGTYTSSGTTLSRDTILESSNSGNAVDWGAGSKDVFVTYPAEKASVTFPAAPKTANYTAAINEGVLTDTTGGTFTVTLPASPITGAVVSVFDVSGTWGTDNLTIGRNGSTISGVAEDLTCDIAGASVQLIYDGTTWNVYAQIGGNGGTAVTLDGTQTLTNKTLGATTLSGTLSAADNLVNRPVLEDYAVEGVAIGNTGATRTIDLESGNFFSATLDQACTFTFSNPAASGDFCGFSLALTNGGAFIITYPASVDWPGGTAPTLTASGLDLLVFVTYDGGTTWLGFVAGLDIKTPA